MISKFKNIVFFIFVLCFPWSMLIAQDGGTSNIFSKGVGARQMGLSGAVVAYATDPTTIFWNPAGMEYLPQKSFSLFYASMLYGTSYNFIGYVHPTLNLGTFGLGVSRIATGDIVERPVDSYIDLNKFSYDQSEFYLSYAKIIRQLVSVGMNIKFERFSMYDLTDIGFGLDLSFMYLPEYDHFLLRNLRLGLTFTNAYAPRLNPGDQKDILPNRILFGLAKPIKLSENQVPLIWLFSVEKGELDSLRIKTGMEYNYQNIGMLRLGFDKDDGFSFGAGAIFRNYQLDYAYKKLVENFSPSHRISFTIHFGKTRDEQFEFVKLRQEKEVNDLAEQQQQERRRQTVERLLKEGEQFFTNGNYFEAKVAFQQVLALDPDNPKAQMMAVESDTLFKEEQRLEQQRTLSESIAEKDRKDTEQWITTHLNQGHAFIDQGDFISALNEYRSALERVPNDENIKSLIAKTEAQLISKIDGLIKKADDLGKRGQYTEAIRYYSEAQLLGQFDDEKYKDISRRIRNLERLINVADFYEYGRLAYQQEKWQEAMQNFEKAKNINPNFLDVQTYYRESERRVNAVMKPIPQNLMKRHSTAMQLYRDRKYEEAIKIWEELLQIQPYNKRLIDNIDDAKKRIEERQRR